MEAEKQLCEVAPHHSPVGSTLAEPFARDIDPKKSTQGVTFTSGFLLVLHGINSRSAHTSHGSLRHPLELFDLQDEQGRDM